MDILQQTEKLAASLEGELLLDDITRTAYSTDASAYREKPLAVAWPAGSSDLKKLIVFCREHKTGLTVRAAGTSLAGQVVGGGIIADISRHMTRILDFNPMERWVLVEPGVILDDLNRFLRPHGLFFGPETSTSNRCNIGGMVGNNACGLHSLVYGSTRDHLISLKCILSDGSEAVFSALNPGQLSEMCSGDTLEARIYSSINGMLSAPENASSIRNEFPHPSIPRRNTGYCLDLLLDSEPFTPGGKPFNLSRLIAGSEGTLAIATEIKLALVPLPPPVRGLLCVHLSDRRQAFMANLTALRHSPSAIEMMDDRILRLTENNLSQRNNRFFISGEPGAILIVEFNRNTPGEIETAAAELTRELTEQGYGYHFPLITGIETSKVWELRKAGLGILSNMKGDATPVSLIEDTAVRVEDLPAYMDDLAELLARYGKDMVLHAHIGTGELHVRPVLNLRDSNDVMLFREIARETALLVKKYKGSLSGEHGDGRLRGEFIPDIVGEHNFMLMRNLKETWDPLNILNPGIIINPAPMNRHLRYDPEASHSEPITVMDFSNEGGIRRAAGKCNGSADCRKPAAAGGVMCPSYMATGDERLSTRARANILREFLPDGESNKWDSHEIHEILDLCLSCKGCKAECPSGVDIAKMKAEFLQHWYDKHGTPLRSWIIAHITSINKLGSLFPSLFNLFISGRTFSGIVKRLTGFAPQRSIPLLGRITARRWALKNLPLLNPENPVSEVLLFIDEFTNYNDTTAGEKCIRLLTTLGYRVTISACRVSGRTFISKGMLRKAAQIAGRNVELVNEFIERGVPIVGIEPSAILSFRDEYPDLLRGGLKEKSVRAGLLCFTFEEFISREFRAGRISSSSFTGRSASVMVHTHCQQKAISGSVPTIEALSVPANYTVTEVKSGCCGMAGSFGYEKEHYELSNKIGELVLFPEVRSAGNDTLLAAPGTSCRHHISDGTGRKAVHPAEVLYDALLPQTGDGG